MHGADVTTRRLRRRGAPSRTTSNCRLSLVEAYALFFVAPLLITALSAGILKDRVEPARWVAVGVGLAGVLVVLRPTGAGMMTLSGLAVLAAAAGYALSAVIVRILGRTDSSDSLVLWASVMMSIGATAIAAPGWVPVRLEHAGILAGIAVSGFFGQVALTEAFRESEPSVVAPFEYALAWGVDRQYTTIQFLPARQSRFTHPDLIPETTFYYRVRAYHGPASDAVAVTLPELRPGADVEKDGGAWASPRIVPEATEGSRHPLRSADNGAAAPTDLRATLQHSSGVLFTWKDHERRGWIPAGGQARGRRGVQRDRPRGSGYQLVRADRAAEREEGCLPCAGFLLRKTVQPRSANDGAGRARQRTRRGDSCAAVRLAMISDSGPAHGPRSPSATVREGAGDHPAHA